MPIDASIPLQYRPAVLEDPGAAQHRVLTLRNLAQQNQQGAQNLEGGQLKLDQERLAIQRDQQYRDIVAAGAGGASTPAAPGAAGPAPQGGLNPNMTVNDQNIGKMVTDLRRAGLAPQADALQDHYNKQQQTRATTAMDLSHSKEFDALVSQKQIQEAASASGALLNRPPEDRAEAYPQTRAGLIAKGLVTPQEWPEQYPGDAWLHQTHDQGLSAQAQIDTHIKQQAEQRAADEFKLKAPGLEADSAIKSITADQFKAGGMPKKDADELARQTAANEESARHNRKDEGIAGGRLAVEQKRFNATLGAGLDANGQPLPADAAKAAAMADPAAVAMAKYQLPPPNARSPLGQAMLRKVLTIDPTYDGTQFQARNKTAQDFSAAGASGKAITSADTALAHLDTLSKAGTALKSSNIQVLNQMANAVGAQAGSSPQTVYDSIVSMVAPEISKAVIGAAGGEGERGGMALNFGSKLSNAQREGNIGAAAGLLGARVHKQAQAYESTMGRSLDRKLSPESQAVLDRYTKPAPSAGGVTVTDPTGGVHTFPTQAAADVFKKKAGIQ